MAIIARAGGGAFSAGRAKPFADFVGLGALAVRLGGGGFRGRGRLSLRGGGVRGYILLDEAVFERAVREIGGVGRAVHSLDSALNKTSRD